MVSRIPTLALAGFHVSQRMRMPMLAVIGIAAGAIVDLPWEMSIFVGLAYLASIPVLYWRRAKLRGHAGGEVHALEEVDDMA
jgi:hypothetical protein